MNDLNRPATVAEVIAITNETAHNVGALVYLALAQISPDAANRFYDQLSSTTNTGNDFDLFLDNAINGIEFARFDLLGDSATEEDDE